MTAETNESKEEEAKNQLIEDESPPSNDGGGGGADFIALYTSLMLLLLSFFIVLFSMATTSTGKFHEAKESLEEEFSSLGLSSAQHALLFVYSFIKIKSALTTTSSEMPNTSQKAPPPDTSLSYWEKEKPPLDITSKMGDLILLGLDSERKDKDLIIRVPASKLFLSETTPLSASGEKLVADTFNIIQTAFSHITIHSYTVDETPLKSSYLISAERAFAIAHFISEHTHCPSDRITYLGYGKYRAIPSDDTAENQAMFNNRIEIIISGLWNV